MNEKPRFKDGDVVRDTELNETFVFRSAMDGSRAERAGDNMRLATEEERLELEPGEPIDDDRDAAR